MVVVVVLVTCYKITLRFSPPLFGGPALRRRMQYILLMRLLGDLLSFLVLLIAIVLAFALAATKVCAFVRAQQL